MCLLIPHIPPEVLSEVIEIACLSGTSLVKLTHVSAYWREVAIRNKKLWTVVLIRNERDMDRAEEYARRSSGVPMMVALALQHSQHIPPVFDRISRYISTSKTFPPIVGSLRVDLSRLEVPNVFTLPSSYNIDLTLFPASLHTVDISLPSVADLDHPFNMPALLRGLATLDKLHSFTLSGDYYWHVDRVPTIPYHLSNLKKIKLSHRHVPALLFLSTPSLSSVHVQVDATDQRPNRVLSRLVTLAGHSLQDLQLHVLNYAADDEDDLLASLPVTNALSPVVWSFPDLHSLSLTIHYSDILACIRADRLTFFMLNMDMFTTAQLGEMTRFLHIHSSTLERVHITITSYYYVRAASAAAGSPPHYPQHTVWPNLHSITIRTTSIVAISPFIPATMPNLKTLSLTIDEFVPADDWELLINFITQISQSLVDLSLHLNTHQPISPGDILGPRPDSDPIVFPALCSFTSTSALADIFVLYLRRAKYVTKIHLVGDDYQWALATSDEDVRSGITPKYSIVQSFDPCEFPRLVELKSHTSSLTLSHIRHHHRLQRLAISGPMSDQIISPILRDHKPLSALVLEKKWSDLSTPHSLTAGIPLDVARDYSITVVFVVGTYETVWGEQYIDWNTPDSTSHAIMSRWTPVEELSSLKTSRTYSRFNVSSWKFLCETCGADYSTDTTELCDHFRLV